MALAKAVAKKLATLGIRLVRKGGKRFLLRGGKELSKKELDKIIIAAAKSLPEQGHHIVTNKGGWGDTFRRLFKRVGMNLDDEINKMALQGHNGRHTERYHELVYSRLYRAIGNKTGQEAKNALKEAINELRKELEKNPRLPYQ